MGILNKNEITRRLMKGELLTKARKDKNGNFDIEPDSYDLTAGAAVWKEALPDNKFEIKTVLYKDDSPDKEQPIITVQPGQMIYVITREEVKLPLEICGTVYSRNNIALKGILGLNAGHVDPGYKGPIVIRLINLKATQWCLKLGDAIFTITFQTVDYSEGDKLESGPVYPFEKMLRRVIETAENSLSNALFDLYAEEIEKRLLSHDSIVEQNLRGNLSEHFNNTYVRQDRLWPMLFRSTISKISGILLIAAAVASILYIFGVIPWW